MPSRPPPPLNALRAFEACARTGSMTRAAGDLCVTHGAISHHVRNLEQRLGRTLLIRGRDGLSLTPDGTALARDLSVAFEIITNAVSRLDAEVILVVSAPATFATKWLVPRLGDFCHRYPGVTVKVIEHNDKSAAGPLDQTDVSITLSPERPVRDDRFTPFLKNSFGPVLSAGLDHGTSFGMENLMRLPRLISSTFPNAWDDWAKIRGLTLPTGNPRHIFHNNTQLLEAVIAGQGAAVTARPFVADAIAAGQLVAPLGFEDRRNAFAFSTSGHLQKKVAQTFCDWLTLQGDEGS